MSSEVSVAWNPLKWLNRNYLAPDFRIKIEIWEVWKDSEGIRVSLQRFPGGLYLHTSKWTTSHNEELTVIVMDPRPSGNLSCRRRVSYPQQVTLAEAGNQTRASATWVDVEALCARVLQIPILEVFLTIRPDKYATAKKKKNQMSLSCW